MEEFFAAPDIAKILHEWHRRNGDFSFIAVVNHHDPVGAVWYRFFNSENHSFGYVNDETPEIGIAVSADYRGKGIGTELMREVIDHAKQIGIKQLSLSVDPHNFALKLYQKLGFTKVSESGTSWTLLKVI